MAQKMQQRRSRRNQVLHSPGGPYVFKRKIGQGTTAAVYDAIHKNSNERVAIKVLNKLALSRQANLLEKVRREIDILARLQHPNIIRLYEVIESKTEIFCIMEVASCDLFEKVVENGRLNERATRQIFRELIEGIAFSHTKLVAHRDLKPENILIGANGKVKIADFGLANKMEDGKFLKTSCGSPNYAAPEVISGMSYVGPEVDIWSLGVVLYVMLCGFLPFEEDNMKRLFRKIKGGIYTLPSHVGKQAKDLIRRMLVVDPERRITADKIRRHPWFTKNDPPLVSFDDAMMKSGYIDPVVMNFMEKKSYLRSHLEDALKLGPDLITRLGSSKYEKQRATSVMYHVLLDKKLREDDAKKMKLAEREKTLQNLRKGIEIPKATVGMGEEKLPKAAPKLETKMSTASIQEKTDDTSDTSMAVEKPFSPEELTTTHKTMQKSYLHKPSTVETDETQKRSWTLGHAHQLRPDKLINSICNALRKKHCTWMMIGNNTLRFKRPGGKRSEKETCMDIHNTKLEVKMGGPTTQQPQSVNRPRKRTSSWVEKEPIGAQIQIYRTRSNRVILDFEKVFGDMFPFMQLCSSIVSTIKNS